jgi:DNA polymerase (family X)
MSQTGAKQISVPRGVAQDAALQFCSLISRACDRIEIAGSIRRKRPSVHDVDIVAIPRFELTPSTTLFGDSEETSSLERRLCELEAQQLITRTKRGERALQIRFRNLAVPVDLYLASEQTWAAMLLIRTGSREHNIYLCTLAKQLGMQLKADGSGLLKNGQVVASDSEEAIFNALNIPFVAPERREGT